MRHLPEYSNCPEERWTGIGIVCGLEAYVDSDCMVTITEGFGITSKGHYICFPGAHFKYYQPYSGQIEGLSSGQGNLAVWKLSTSKDGAESAPLNPQTIGEERFIDGKVALLYLEAVEGNRRQIQPLVVRAVDLWPLLKKQYRQGTINGTAYRPEKDDVDLIAIEDDDVLDGRQLFLETNPNTSLSFIEIMRFGHGTMEKECEAANREFTLTGNDFQAVFDEYEILILHILDQLPERIAALHAPAFQVLFPPQQRDFLEQYVKFLIDTRWPIFKEKEATKPQVQYFYDFLRDLAGTYNEIVAELCKLTADCIPDKNQFSYHLLLGEMLEDVAFGPSVFRHQFHQPPVFNNNADRLQRIRFLHWRMTMMIKCFYVPGAEPVDIVDNHYAQVMTVDDIRNSESTDPKIPIRITPAAAPGAYPSPGTIPFYYYTADDPNSIHHWWNYDALRCGKLQHLYAYHADNEESYTDLCSVKRPFSHDIRPYPFYRIEGQNGQSLNEALVSLYLLRKRNNLEFAVIGIRPADAFQQEDRAGKDFALVQQGWGMEHLSGVFAGGGFGLLYEDIEDSETKMVIGNRVFADFSIRNYSESMLVLLKGKTVLATNTSEAIKEVKIRLGSGRDAAERFEVADSGIRGIFHFLLSKNSPHPEEKYKLEAVDEHFLYEFKIITVKEEDGTLKIYEKGDEHEKSEIILELKPVTATFYLELTTFKNLDWISTLGISQIESIYKFYQDETFRMAIRWNNLTMPLQSAGLNPVKPEGLNPINDLELLMRVPEFLTNKTKEIEKDITGILAILKNYWGNNNPNIDHIFTRLWEVFVYFVLDRLVLDEGESKALWEVKAPAYPPKYDLKSVFKKWQAERAGKIDPQILAIDIDKTTSSPEVVEINSKKTSEKTIDADDLTKIEGISTKTAAALKKSGIDTYQKLAATSLEDLNKVLQSGKLNVKRLNPGAWIEQAKLAAEGKWDELAALQEKLKKADS